jgi:LysR family transcriptional regulator of gallate degradation
VPLRLLRAAEAVARRGSAAAAAAELHLSASAVSRAVAQAEQQLGVPLFERGARGMACTPAGEALLRRVGRARQQLALAAGATLAGRATDAMLQALVAVAERRSETAAAQQLGITQAAVHQSLRQLEHAARVPLFLRSHRGTRLTEAGERLLLRAKLAGAELRAGHDELSAACGGAPGRVAVGALPMASDVLVPQALARLLAAQPGVQALVADGTYEALLHQLRHGDVDLVVGPLRGAQAPADITEELLFVDRLQPVVRSGHPLAQGRRPARTLKALLACAWIGPLPGTPARAAFERAFEAEGLAVPPVGLQVNSPAVVRSVLMASDAVALVSPLQIRGEVASGLLTVLPVPVQHTERAIGLMQRRDGLASPVLQALVAALRAVAAASAPRS